MIRRDHLWLLLIKHPLGCLGLNPGQLHAKQMPYTLYDHSDPTSHFLEPN